MSAPSTSSLSVELLSRVIDVEYGCFTFLPLSSSSFQVFSGYNIAPMPLSIKYCPQHCSKDKAYSVYVLVESTDVCFCLSPSQSLNMNRSSCLTYWYFNFLLLVGVATLFKLRRSNPTLLSSRASYKIKETIIRVGKKKSWDLNCLLSTIKNPIAQGIYFVSILSHV